jgi:hypothetical protein
LAIILFDVWPVEIVLLKRRQRFLRSLLHQDFAFIKDAVQLDRDLLTTTNSWHNALVRLLRLIDPDLSTVDLVAHDTLDLTLSGFTDRSSVNFYFIQDGDSESLSFFRLFLSLETLNSFRLFLSSLGPDQCRLIILFCASLLRFRLCSTIRDVCPLCKKPWLWRHFFDCPRLGVTPGASGRAVALHVVTCAGAGDWGELKSLVRSNLLHWRTCLPDFVFPCDIIQSL